MRELLFLIKKQHPLFFRRNTLKSPKPITATAALHNNTFNQDNRGLSGQNNRSLSNHQKDRIHLSPERGHTAYTRPLKNYLSPYNMKVYREEEEEIKKPAILQISIQTNDEILNC